MTTILYKVAVACLLVFAFNSAHGEDSAGKVDSSVYKLSLEVGSGASMMMNKMNSRRFEDINLFAMVRLMWRPDRILNIGIEADYLDLMNDQRSGVETEFGTTDFRAKLFCYPINGILSMKLFGIDIYAGAGIAFVISRINAFDETSETHIITGSYTYAMAYSIPLTPRLSMGAEGKVFIVSTVNKVATSLILKLNWDILVW